MTSPAHGGSFRVLRTAHVAPSSSAGAGCNPLPEATMPLTFLDAIWLIRPPVERVFFYRLGDGGGATCDVDVALSRVVDSLARALHVFYPLAGRLRLTPGKANRYELFYQPGDAVAFTVAEPGDAVAFTVAELGGVGLDELATDVPREVSKIAPLVPELPDGGAVLAMLATVLLPAGRALTLGVTVHHAACDGASSTHFLHTWAAICAGAAATPPPPVIDRTSIREREDIHDVMTARLHDHVKTTTTTNSPDVVDNVEAEPRNHMAAVPTSSSSPISGHGWNPASPTSTSETATDIAAAGADGLFAACSAIAAAVDEGTRYDPGYWNRCREQSTEVSTSGAPPLSVAGSPRFRVYDVDFGFGRPAKRCREHVGGMSASDGPPLVVAESPRFRVYDVDFGFGRPVKVDVVFVAKSGTISVAEGRGGGIEVGVGLPPERMERFRRCFADAVAWLSSPSRPVT
uniref:Uncharacterized protein n=1 Tax=Oryza meridionalis TaxID=40149 RepID=A0A0E0CKJ2_9ORYZ